MRIPATIAAVGLLAAAARAPIADRATAQTRETREMTLYVSVLDAEGAPVVGLSNADFIVREDRVRREVLRVSRAVEPLDIVLLVDDSQAVTRHFTDIRKGLEAFVKDMAGANQIAITALADRPTILTDYTNDPARLQQGINRIFPRTDSGAYLLQAMIETCRGISKREAERRAIVAVVSDGVEFSDRHHELVLKPLRESGAAFHAVVVESGGGSGLSDWERERNLVLDRGTRETGGGRHTLLTSMAIAGTLTAIAAELKNQYKVVYARPQSLIPPEQTTVDVVGEGRRARGTLARMVEGV